MTHEVNIQLGNFMNKLTHLVKLGLLVSILALQIYANAAKELPAMKEQDIKSVGKEFF